MPGIMQPAQSGEIDRRLRAGVTLRVISSLRVAPVAAASVFPVCRRSWMWIFGSPDAASALAHTFEKLLRRRNEDQLMRNSPGQPGLGHSATVVRPSSSTSKGSETGVSSAARRT